MSVAREFQTVGAVDTSRTVRGKQHDYKHKYGKTSVQSVCNDIRAQLCVTP